MTKKDSLIYLEIERSKLAREKARMALWTGIMLYVGLTLTGVIGFSFQYISMRMLYVFIATAIAILALGTIPYIMIIQREEKLIAQFMRKLRRSR